jgi:ribosomal protein S18 acetylase RimI-like enzyme
MSTWSSTYQGLRPLRPEDFGRAIALWDSVPGVVLRAEDRDLVAFSRFLQHNPRLSWGMWDGPELLGAVLAGHDGRRGYIYHLAVTSPRTRLGLGSLLVTRVKQEMRLRGIYRFHAHVLKDNAQARAFWTKVGWIARDDLDLLSWAPPGSN